MQANLISNIELADEGIFSIAIHHWLIRLIRRNERMDAIETSCIEREKKKKWTTTNIIEVYGKSFPIQGPTSIKGMQSLNQWVRAQIELYFGLVNSAKSASLVLLYGRKDRDIAANCSFVHSLSLSLLSSCPNVRASSWSLIVDGDCDCQHIHMHITLWSGDTRKRT